MKRKAADRPYVAEELPKSYRGRYPFRIGTTSFIYPDNYSPNVELLAPYLDEIELLFLESPSRSDNSLINEIKDLADLAIQFSITYNVHLPTDISLGNSDPSVRQRSVESVTKMVELATHLSPTTCTLHLDYEGHSQKPENIRTWQGHIRDSLVRLFDAGVNPNILSVETLSYPFQWIDGIIREFDLRICMDVGHLMANHTDALTFYRQYAHAIRIIHLHGIEGDKDHLPLDRLSRADFEPILQMLGGYTGILSIEVFSYPALTASLDYLEQACRHIGSE